MNNTKKFEYAKILENSEKPFVHSVIHANRFDAQTTTDQKSNQNRKQNSAA